MLWHLGLTTELTQPWLSQTVGVPQGPLVQHGAARHAVGLKKYHMTCQRTGVKTNKHLTCVVKQAGGTGEDWWRHLAFCNAGPRYLSISSGKNCENGSVGVMY